MLADLHGTNRKQGMEEPRLECIAAAKKQLDLEPAAAPMGFQRVDHPPEIQAVMACRRESPRWPV